MWKASWLPCRRRRQKVDLGTALRRSLLQRGGGTVSGRTETQPAAAARDHPVRHWEAVSIERSSDMWKTLCYLGPSGILH